MLSGAKRRKLLDTRSYEELAAHFSHMEDYLQIEQLIQRDNDQRTQLQPMYGLQDFRDHPWP